MRIALLSPLPPVQNGIANYAARFRAALEAEGVDVATPLMPTDDAAASIDERLKAFQWESVDLVHAELGGGRLEEFHALETLRDRYPGLPLTATAHDPERLVWRRARFPWPLSFAARLPPPFPQAAALLTDPLTLREERRLAGRLNHLVTLTRTGASLLAARMKIDPRKISTIPHGNPLIAPAPLPDTSVLRLLYFGFLYRGKGIEDLVDALAQSVLSKPSLQKKIRLTLAGGSAPETAFGPHRNYLDGLRRRIEEAGLSDSIDWQLDVADASIPALIQAHHVMVLPYRESAKLALLGKMRGTSGALSWARACGRGVITSDARAFAEEVSAANGITYPQGNIDALAARILALAENRDRIAEWSRQAGKLAVTRAWPNTARRFMTLFQHVCEGAR